MSNSYHNFENIDSLKNSPVIRERVTVLSAFMYKQFCEYQHSNENTGEIFAHMISASNDFVEIIKQSFAARGIATENIWAKVDTKIPAILINIFWQQFSFTMRCNFKPQVLFRENEKPVSSGRIMAIKGDYFDLIKSSRDTSEEMSVLLENEIASLFVPDDKMSGAILKVKHRANNEFILTQTDAGREFMLLVAESVCGTNVYHEEGSRKSFNI